MMQPIQQKLLTSSMSSPLIVIDVPQSTDHRIHLVYNRVEDEEK